MNISLLSDYPDETATIAKWYFDEWASKVPNVTQAMVFNDLSKKASNQDIPLIIIAHEGGKLIGVIELKLRENKHYPDYVHWVAGVFVDPSNRGKGIGKALLNEAKRVAVCRGVQTLYLQCESHNIELYKSQGFQILHDATSNNVETTIMSWCAVT